MICFLIILTLYKKKNIILNVNMLIKKNKWKGEKKQLCKSGITLIALVITVIVLLILAGAAVSISLNEENIFEKANTAKQDWNKKVEEEESSLQTAISNGLNYVGLKIPEGLQVGDTINWEPSGHYTWNAQYYASDEEYDFGDGNIGYWNNRELYSGSEAPAGAKKSWDFVNPTGIDLSISSWRVLKINGEEKKVTLVPTEPVGELTLGGAQGYNNGIKLLNDACSALYGNYAGVSARCINIEDIDSFMTSNTAKQIINDAKNTATVKYRTKMDKRRWRRVSRWKWSIYNKQNISNNIRRRRKFKHNTFARI